MLPILNPLTTKDHPCIHCGACCAAFRVAFYWREAELDESTLAVPQDLWIELTENYRAMKGTSQIKDPKCIALKGIIGTGATCSIYSNRPSPCRDFKASYEDGIKNERCDEARFKHKLSPLSQQDWPKQ